MIRLLILWVLVLLGVEDGDDDDDALDAPGALDDNAACCANRAARIRSNLSSSLRCNGTDDADDD